MKNSKSKVISILGGSNSIKKNGISRALNRYCKLYNFSLGASGSSQNLYEIYRNKDIIESSDLVISESNVNDFHNANLIDLSIENIEESIKNLYHALASLETVVLVLLLPLHSSNFKFAKEINDIHLKYIHLLGLNYLDIHSYLKPRFEMYDYENLDHLPSIYLYRLGERLVDYQFSKHQRQQYNWLKYRIINEFDGLYTESKNNSLLNESVKLLDCHQELYFRYSDYQLVAIHAWSDKPSGIKIESEKKYVCKRFIAECQFQEVAKSFSIAHNYKLDVLKDEDKYEKSIRVDGNESLCNEMKIIALFLISKNELNQFIKQTDLKGKSYRQLLDDVFDIEDGIDEIYRMQLYREVKKSFLKKLIWKITGIRNK